ncbi:MAG: DEAD/DEAH box helicase family protein [Treponemataceae bacterium]
MSGLKPEEVARIKIDEMLKLKGWDVVSRQDYSDRYNACAVTESLLNGNLEADYLLYVGGKAIAVLEAKRSENKLSADVAAQATNYTQQVPDWCLAWENPLPFIFLSNGETLLFKDQRITNDDTTETKDSLEPEFSVLKAMFTPKELAERANIKQPYAKLPAVPSVKEGGLRQCQYDAISNLELSFKHQKNKALIILATGAGKTFTACTAAYRLLTYTHVRRILFLVDRNNLGKQAEGEFTSYRLTETKDAFSNIYTVQRLSGLKTIEKSNVVISTIQRLFAAITGQQLTEENDDDESDFNDSIYTFEQEKAEIELGNNLLLSPDYFDVIIVDECHRSIYGRWKKVLTYFSKATIIGLTATPTAEAYAFFNKNTVVNYTYEDSVKDGVNVSPRIFRIKTRETEQGGHIAQDSTVYKLNKRTGTKEVVTQEEETAYTNTDLDRSIVNPTQIRQIVETYKQSIYSTLYPDRYTDFNCIPKTLFFAKSDSHATNIVEIIKDVFKSEFPNNQLPENYVQKITYNAGNSNELIRQFRNNKEFRIAVTVTLVATGTDVRPLEVLVFMRDIHSSILYTQMKGRGCRKISDDNLQEITPNAQSKDCFYLVDAVGVTEHEKTIPEINTNDDKELAEPIPSLEKLFEKLAHGEVHDKNLTLLSNYLAKIQNKGEPKDLQELALLIGTSLEEFLSQLIHALQSCQEASLFADDDFSERSVNRLPEYTDINHPNTERKVLISNVITKTKARQKILEINAGFIRILMPGSDEVLYTGFSKEEAQNSISAFESYINTHKDEIEALRIVYNSEDCAISYEMLQDLQKKLMTHNHLFKAQYLWQNYKVLKADNTVIPLESKSQVEAITNLIQLARFAYGKIDLLQPMSKLTGKRFGLYVGQNRGNIKNSFTKEQIDVLRQIADYIAQNGCVTKQKLAQTKGTSFLSQIISLFGKDNIDEQLDYYSKFLLNIKVS